MNWQIDKSRAFILRDCRKKKLSLSRYYIQYAPSIPKGTLFSWVEGLLRKAYHQSSETIPQEVLSILEDWTYCVHGSLSEKIQQYFVASHLSYAAELFSDESTTEETSAIMEEPIQEIADNDKHSVKTIIERNTDGKISQYLYTIYRRDGSLLEGALSREEMAFIYRMYSSYGDNLTQATVSRSFTNLSLYDFKRILQAFNITKASAPFAPHQIEEMSDEEMRAVQLREKENSFLRRSEIDRVVNDRKLLDKYIKENIELKQQLQDIKEFAVTVDPQIMVNTPVEHAVETDDNTIYLNIYLADMHLGATVTTGTLYPENIHYGWKEAQSRLTQVLKSFEHLERFNHINVILLGDAIDCCGVPNMTARMNHTMPENMDPKEQVNTYISLMIWFVNELYFYFPDIDIHVYSVPNGNHDGVLGYVANKTVLTAISKYFSDVRCTMWEQFFGTFSIHDHTFICFHGGDERYHKVPFPLVLNDNTKVKLYEWLHYNDIRGNHIHFIKGDLHSSNIESCMRLDYRNVLSLFGASDYSSMNYSRNSYGVSYDIIKNNLLLRGDIINM